MKKQNITTIFNNYNSYEVVEEIKLDLKADSEYDDMSETELSDYAYDLASEYEREDWEEMISVLDRNLQTKWIVSASIGTWQGRRDGYRIFDDTKEMLSVLCEHCDYIKVWIENNNLFIKASHHDGTNIYQCKVLTPKGCITFDNWNWGCGDGKLFEKSEFEVYEMLFAFNFYSKNIKIDW
jgi:hypothetical protein